jgi:Cu(I)/Ag(I) efflux system membrane fusion protein
MNRAGLASAAAAFFAAAGTVLVVAGAKRPTANAVAVVAPAAAEEGRAPIYYQDPDGRPSYALTPRKTPDGRDYRAVPAGGGISFDEDAPATMRSTARASGGSGERRIKYYRNPMGLPDTSRTPKKDSMGMDYIPVYEGDDSDDGSVKLSPGRIQRTGVKSEPAAERGNPYDRPRPRHDPTRRAARVRHLDEIRKLRPESRQRHDGFARPQRPTLAGPGTGGLTWRPQHF